MRMARHASANQSVTWVGPCASIDPVSVAIPPRSGTEQIPASTKLERGEIDATISRCMSTTSHSGRGGPRLATFTGADNDSERLRQLAVMREHTMIWRVDMNPRSIVVALVVLFGCKSPTEQVRVSETKPSPPVDTPKAGSVEDLTEKMRHCPVTLPGVHTELEDVDGGIRFVLHANTPDVIADARKRANELVAFTAGRANEKHGGGHGGGFMRNCPIVTKDSKVTADEIDGGVRITVTPNNPKNILEIRAKARERLERAPLERASVIREEKSPAGD